MLVNAERNDIHRGHTALQNVCPSAGGMADTVEFNIFNANKYYIILQTITK